MIGRVVLGGEGELLENEQDESHSGHGSGELIAREEDIGGTYQGEVWRDVVAVCEE